MRTLRIDFTSENILPDGCIAGRIGEHNATTLVITPPSEITACESASSLCIAFFTGVGIIHSEVIPKAEKLQIPLWKQLTQYSTLAVQLEAYDDNGDLVVKSSVVSLKLLPSLCGEVVETDTENPNLTAQVAQNSKSRHNHENGAVLDCFGLNYAGNRPTFMGKNNIVAFQSDILDRLRDYALTSTVPNAATVDGSTLKMQRKTNNASVDLFSVDLPASGSDRPTVTTEEVHISNVVYYDIPMSGCFFIGDTLYDIKDENNQPTGEKEYFFPELKLGTEIKTIEIKIGENGEWVDIHDMQLVDGQPYILYMNRVFDGYDIFGLEKGFAIISPTYFGENYVYTAAVLGEDGYIRITYYTDNIGGENNA